MCLDVVVDSVPAHLANNETFILTISGVFPWCVPFSCTKKSSTARGTEYSTRMQTRNVVSGCISVRSCRSAAANPCNCSAHAEHLVPRLRPGPLDNVQRSHVELQFSTSRSEWNCQSASWPEAAPEAVYGLRHRLGTTREAFTRGPELHRKDLTISLYQVVARARRSSDAAVLQV